MTASWWLAVALLGAPGDEPPPPRVDIVTEVVSVEVPVQVRNDDGEPVRGLSRDRFVLRDEGEVQAITGFTEVDLGEAPADSVPPPEARRHFLFFFDLAFTPPSGILRAREAAARFAEGLRRSDLAAVATYAPVQGIRLLVPFSSDLEQVRHALLTLGLQGLGAKVQDPLGFLISEPGELTPPVTDLFSERRAIRSDMLSELQVFAARLNAHQEEVYRAEVLGFLDRLDELADGIHAVRGHKMVLLFSQGFDGKFLVGQTTGEFAADAERLRRGQYLQMPVHNRFGSKDVRDRLEKALERLSSANSTVYAIDVSPDRGNNLGEAQERVTVGGEESLYQFARATGGLFYRDVGDVSSALEDVSRKTEHYYVLSFEPATVKRRGHLHDLSVTVPGSKLKVTHRTSYREELPYAKRSELERRLETADAVAKGVARKGLQASLRVSAFPGSKGLDRLGVVVQLPGEGLLAARGSPDRKLEFYGYSVDGDGVFRDHFHKHVRIDLARARDRLRQAGMKYVDVLVARPGTHTVKVLIRDVETGAQGFLSQQVEAPDFAGGELRLVGPIPLDRQSAWLVVRGYDPGSARPERRAALDLGYPFHVLDTDYVPAVAPRIAPGEPEQVALEAWNLALDEATGEPRTRISLEVVDETGDARDVAEAALLGEPRRGARGDYGLAFRYVVDSAPPGTYRLRVTLVDEIRERTATAELPFELVAARARKR